MSKICYNPVNGAPIISTLELGYGWVFRPDNTSLFLERGVTQIDELFSTALGDFNFSYASNGFGTANVFEIRKGVTVLVSIPVTGVTVGRWQFCVTESNLALQAIGTYGQPIATVAEVVFPTLSLGSVPSDNMVPFNYVPSLASFRYFDPKADQGFVQIGSNVPFKISIASVSYSILGSGMDMVLLFFLTIYRMNGFSGVYPLDYLKSGYTDYFYDQGSISDSISAINGTTIYLNDAAELYPATAFPPTYDSQLNEVDARLYARLLVEPSATPSIGDYYQYSIEFEIEEEVPPLVVTGQQMECAITSLTISQWPTVTMTSPNSETLVNDSFVTIPLNSDTFDFMGTTYSDVYLSSNGLISFGSSNAGETVNLFSAFDLPQILFFWGRLQMIANLTTVEHEIAGGQLVIQINKFDYNYCRKDSVRLGQIEIILKLNQGNFTNDIEINYGNLFLHPRLKTIAGLTRGSNVSIPKPIRQIDYATGIQTLIPFASIEGYFLQEFLPSSEGNHPLSWSKVTFSTSP